MLFATAWETTADKMGDAERPVFAAAAALVGDGDRCVVGELHAGLPDAQANVDVFAIEEKPLVETAAWRLKTLLAMTRKDPWI